MKLFNKINKIMASSVLSAGMIATSFCGISMINSARNFKVYATPFGEKTLDNKINNSELVQSTGEAFGEVRDWTKAEGSDSHKDNKDKFVAGTMDLTSNNAWNSNYEETFMLEEGQNPYDGTTSDKKYMFINNFSNSPVKYGYKSNAFELTNNSYYSITVKLKTITNPGETTKASLYLNGVDTNPIKIENISSKDSWDEFTFYIETNSINSATNAQLEIWLGSKTNGSYGALFVDNVIVKQYDKATFYAKNNKNSAKSILTNLNEKISDPFENNDFENELLGWKSGEENSNDSSNQLIKSIKVGSGFNNMYDTQWNAPNPYTINTPSNENALLISNKTDLISGVESPSFLIKQHGFYKVSVWAYSKCNIGNGATIVAKETDGYGTKLAYTVLNVANNTEGSQVNSNWVEYNIYVQGNSFKDTKINLGLYLGSPTIGENEAKPTKGYVYFDEVKLQELSYSEYQKAVENSKNSTTLNISEEESEVIVANGEFNKTQNNDNSIKYPLSPIKYGKTTKNKQGDDVTEGFTSGIVNLDKIHWNNNKANYGEAKYPGEIPGKKVEESSNNVLMVGTTNPTLNQTYRTDAFELIANSYYKVSFYAQTQIYPNYETGATFRLNNGSHYIYKIDNINTHDVWKQYTLYLKTGSSNVNASIELGLKYNNGYAFFDELKVTKFEDEKAYNNAIKPSDITFDLTKETFDTENTFKGNFDESIKNQSSKDNLTSGIENVDGNNVLAINSNGSDTIYYFASSDTIQLKADSYTKISIDVYTENLNQEEENKVLDKDKNVIPFGAIIQLKNSTGTFNESIKGINTSLVNKGNNKFTTYTFYVAADKDVDAYMYLGLGYKDALTCGTVYFDNITVDTSITKEQFDEAKNNLENESTSLFIDNIVIKEDEKKDEEVEKEKEPFEFPWILVSSLITGLAIIVALIGYFVRKINIHKKPKIKTTYDRRKTLDIDLDRKEKIKLRESMIEELKLQLHTIDDEIEQIKQMYETKEAQLIIAEKAKKEKILKDKEAVTAERENATKEYKSILASDATQKEKQIAERNFARYITKLSNREIRLQKLLDQKQTSSTLLKIKREQDLQRYIEAQTQIKNEIEKIEREIEEIAKEDAQVWEEYKREKAEAKERKIQYNQEKKLEKEKLKDIKKEKKASKTSKKDSDSKNK